MIAESGLRGRLGSGAFAVTAEIGPPRGADPGELLRKAEPLRGWVDAVNITDNAGAHVRMASWAGSLLVAQAGIEPVMQLTSGADLLQIDEPFLAGYPSRWTWRSRR